MTVFVRLLHLYFVWSIIYVIYYLRHIDDGICKITSPVLIYYLGHIDDGICKITSPVLIYYLRHIDDGICKTTSPVFCLFSRCGVINKKTKYRWSNLTNTVINVPEIVYQYRWSNLTNTVINVPEIVYHIDNIDDGICKITSPVFCMIYYLCDILSQAHWWRYL
jgi:hypothetical protein